MKGLCIGVYVNAGNDNNGNPRRGWLVVDAKGDTVDFVDHEYAGRGALEKKYPGIGRSIELTITPACYRALRKLARS